MSLEKDVNIQLLKRNRRRQDKGDSLTLKTPSDAVTMSNDKNLMAGVAGEQQTGQEQAYSVPVKNVLQKMKQSQDVWSPRPPPEPPDNTTSAITITSNSFNVQAQPAP